MAHRNHARVALGALALSVSACASASPHRAEPSRTAPADVCAAGAVHIRTLAPASLDLSAGDVTPVDILGCGFADTNTVKLGPITMNGVASLDGGTRIRITVPPTLPARGEVPPMRMPVGTVDVTVTARNTTSNRASLVLK